MREGEKDRACEVGKEGDGAKAKGRRGEKGREGISVPPHFSRRGAATVHHNPKSRNNAHPTCQCDVQAKNFIHSSDLDVGQIGELTTKRDSVAATTAF